MPWVNSLARSSGGFFKSQQVTKKAIKLNNLKQFRSSDTFVVGRRIIDINHFGKQFDAGCQTCGEQIFWRNLVDETIYGLCCALYFRCEKCSNRSKIYSSGATDVQSAEKRKRMRPFSVNVKAALGMIHAGVGSTHLNAILVTLGLPLMNPKTLKRRERDIGPVIEAAAKASCTEVTNLEKSLACEVQVNAAGDNQQRVTFEEALEYLEADHDDCNTSMSAMDENIEETPSTELISKETSVDVTVSQDAAWSKRGKAMNSLSGVGHVIGHKTRKCLNFSTRIKKCNRCSYYQNKNRPVPKHDCRLNWTQSAKSMEADIAVQLHREAGDNNVKYAGVVGDDDSSAIKQIREKVYSDVQKFSDLTHIKRTVSSKLYDMSKLHTSLTEKVRLSILKNFTYAVHQNREKGTEELQQALRSIVPHMYGEHTACSEWCGYLTNSSYRHVNLPNGKDLADTKLKDALHTLLDTYANNSSKLMTTGDSQANESLNNVIFSKAPKFRNYNKSESFDYRCAAGVLQFNEGKHYLDRVISDCTLSPRKETTDYVLKESRKRSYCKSFKSKRTHKKRRIELRNVRKQKERTSNIKLGTSYESGCCFEEDTLDTVVISDPPQHVGIDCQPNEFQTIFVDVETTKLGYRAELTQIGACLNESECFSSYILPEGQISQSASNITGLKLQTINGEKMLYKHGTKVNAESPKVGITKFINWLGSINVAGCRQVICAHNGDKFDFPVLFLNIEKQGLINNLKDVVHGVADSISIMKQVDARRKSYALGNIYRDLFHEEFESHDALNDALAVHRIFSRVSVSQQNILADTTHIDCALIHTKNKVIQREQVNALQSKLSQGESKHIISDRIARKMCCGGVTYEMLMLAYQSDHEHGITSVLSEKVNDRVRVTNRTSIINSIIQACAKKY